MCFLMYECPRYIELEFIKLKEFSYKIEFLEASLTKYTEFEEVPQQEKRHSQANF